MSKFLLVLSALMSLVSVANAQSSYQYRVPLKIEALSAQEGQLSVSPTQLSFADLAVGQASSSALVLQNTGEVAVALTGFSYSGSSAFMLDTSTCPGSLAASAVCAVGVTFAPQARGDQSGEVLIRFDSNQLVVPLTGRALQGELQADAAALVFDPVLVPGNSSKSLRIQNTGDASVSGINLSTQAPFSVSLGCSTIMPGDACELTLTFAPAAPGNFSEGLALSSPVGGLSVSLSGQGIAQTQTASLTPALLDFGTVLQGSASVQRSVTVTNTGNTPMSVTAVAGLPAGVTVQSNSCTSVQPSASCSISLSLATAERTEFSATPAQLSGPTNTPAVALTGKVAGTQVSILSGAPVAFGSVVQGAAAPERSVTLSNTGNTAMTLSGLSNLPTGVTVATNQCSGVAPAASCSIVLRLATDVARSVSGTATTVGANSNASFAISGSVEAATSVATLTAGSPVSFGSVTQGAAAVSRTVTLSNTGNSPMTLTGLSNLPAGVTVATNQCSGVAPAASCSIVLRLATDVARSVSGNASTIGANSNASFAISGAVEAATSVATLTAGSPVSFGSVTQGAAAVSRTVTLSNTGNSPMTLTGLSNLPSAVTVTGNTCSAIAPNNTCTLTLQMATTSIVNFSQNVTTVGASTNATVSVTGAITSAISDYTTLNYNWFSSRTPSRAVSGTAEDHARNAKFTITVNGQTFTQSAYMYCSDGCDTNTYFDIFSATQAGAMGASGNSLLYQLRVAFPTWSITNVDSYTIRINPPEGVAYSVSATAAAGRYGTGANLSGMIGITAAP